MSFMPNQINHISPYPGGHIQYEFDMRIIHDKIISCKIVHPKVKEVAFEKVNPTDQFDDKWLMTVHIGEVYSIEEVQEIGNTIRDDILDMLSLTLNTKISEMRVVGYNLVPRPGEGSIAHILLPLLKVTATCISGCLKLSSDDIEAIQNGLLRMSNLKYKPLIRLFRYAISTDEPVVQFMLLYLILYEIRKKQSALDRYIMKVAPTTPQSASPHTGKPETIYTKLRNEITHRSNVGHETTRAQIINHLYKFRAIVLTALKKLI